jgi:hypothetical protein
MDLYTILFILAIIAVVVITVVLTVIKPLKNHYSYNMTQDDLFKSHKDEYGYNYIYSTSGETRKFINKYVIRVNHSTKTLICNYTKYFDDISFYIVCMNNGKPINVLRVNEKNTQTKTSMIFLLPPKTKTVNVVICEADGVSFNDKIIAPIPKTNCRLYTLLSGINVLSIMYIIRHLIVLIFAAGYEDAFYKDIFNLISLGAMLAIFVVYLMTTSVGLRKRNWKTKVGGSLEYEFF